MQPGKRDTKITIEDYTETRGSSGGVIKTWTKFADLWANMKGLTSREIFQKEQLTHLNTVIFNTLYIQGVSSEMRIKAGGKIYDIRGIQEIGRRKELQIVAENSGETY